MNNELVRIEKNGDVSGVRTCQQAEHLMIVMMIETQYINCHKSVSIIVSKFVFSTVTLTSILNSTIFSTLKTVILKMI